MKLRAFTATLMMTTMCLSGAAYAEDLRDALVSVYTENPRLLAERARLREIDESYVQARAQGRFTIGGSASVSQAWVRIPSGGNLFGPVSGGGTDNSDLGASDMPNEIGLQVIQPLYQGGRVKALKEQAKLGILAARENLRAQENAVFLSTANAYVDVRRDEEAARIRRNNVRVLSRQLEAATARFEVGQGTRTDTAQSESRLALSEAGLAQADAQLAISRAAYVRLVGRMPNLLTPPPQFALPENLSAAIMAARENNPQLIGAYFNEAGGRAAINVAKSSSRPTLSLSGNASRQRDQLSGISSIDSAAITAQLTIPFYSGGANQSRRRQAEHAKTRLAFETRDAELAIDEAVTQIWAQLTAARASLTAVRRQQEAAQIAFEGVTLEQTVGTRDQLDVLNAEQEVLNAKLSVVEAERNVSAATFSLLSTMGVFDAEGIRLPVEMYDKNANLDIIRYKGLTEAVDKYAPEFAQRIGRQLPNIAGDVSGAAQAVYTKTPIQTGVEGVVALANIGAQGVKEGADSLTGIKPAYNDLQESGAIVIDVNPIKPASVPPYDLLIDADKDGQIDEIHLPVNSPVD